MKDNSWVSELQANGLEWMYFRKSQSRKVGKREDSGKELDIGPQI